MKLDDAIAHCTEKRQGACAEDHMQLRDWLIELKQFRHMYTYGRDLPKPGNVYVHFKGTNYVIAGYCVNATNGANPRPMVIYFPENQFDVTNRDYFVRDLQEFLSTTDMTKYPDAKRKWRFVRTFPNCDFSEDDEEDETDD